MELATALGGLEKFATKKEDKEDKKVKEEDEEDKEDEEDEEEEDKNKDEEKEDKEEDEKEEKKAKAIMEIVHGLSKLANDLDEVGANEASSLVDDALKVIVYNIEQE